MEEPVDVEQSLDTFQTGLDAGGLVPGVGEPLDFLNTLISLARGDTEAAALSMLAMVPGLGAGATGLKYADEAAAAAKCYNSFTGDTPVLTPDGQTPIADIQEGDTVLAFNPQTQTTGVYPVTAVISHPTIVPGSVNVVLQLDDERLETTPEHRFFTVDAGWIEAEDLTVGDQIAQADGTPGTVRAIATAPRTARMYNLTVAVAHTFFVGDDAWLVHNCGDVLAETADTALKSLPEDLRRATIGAAQDANGVVLSVYHRTAGGTVEAVQALRDQGYRVLDAPTKRGPAHHAERQLHRAGFTDIGVSRQRGMCNSCSSFFSRRPDVTVTPYSRRQ